MSFENVVLSYPQPHIAVYVEDNTGYTETFSTNTDTPVRMIQCGPFAQGRDNQVLYCDSYDAFINEFGKPNYKFYGQAAYNVAAALKTGYAAAYILRVMPDDATYANKIISVTYKVITDETSGLASLHVAYTATSVAGISSVSELQAEMSKMTTDGAAPDENGYYTKPLFAFYSSGRGVYGNDTRFRIVDITAYDDTTVTYRDYRVDVLVMDDTLTRKEYAYGSFNETLFDKDNRESLYLEDLINDPEEGLGKIRFLFNDVVYDELIEMYNTQVIAPNAELLGAEALNEDENGLYDEVDASTFDIISLYTMNGSANTNIVLDTLANSVSFGADTEGITLENGEDGSVAVGADGRDELVEQLLIDAYSGKIDKTITSRYATPADFMLDAGFTDTVKRQMAALALRRKYDCMTYLDAGLLNTTTEVIAWLKSMRTIMGNNILTETQNYKIRDIDYTGKTIPVTTTYFLASLIPTHIKTLGINVPMARKNARITDCVKGSFKPVIDPDDNDIKKEFYNLRGNYYETVRYNVYQRGLAITRQKDNTDRLDEFNEYILQLAVNTCNGLMSDNLYDWAEESDRLRYQTIAETVLESVLGGMVRSATVQYSMSTDDERKSILRIKLRLVYKTVAKRGIVEVYLDPRVSTDSTVTEVE